MDARKEVESHSSSITNVRIGNIKAEVWQSSLGVMSQPKDPKKLLHYFSSLVILYLETPGLYSDEDFKIVNEQINDGNIIASRMRIYGKPTKYEIENLLQICLRVHSIINQSLQKMRYLFRTGVQEQKGLDAAMKIFEMDKWKKKTKNESAKPISDKPGEQPKITV